MFVVLDFLVLVVNFSDDGFDFLCACDFEGDIGFVLGRYFSVLVVDEDEYGFGVLLFN